MGILGINPSKDLHEQVYEISMFLNRQLPLIKTTTDTVFDAATGTTKKVPKEVPTYEKYICRAIKAGLRSYFNELANRKDLLLWQSLGNDFKSFLSNKKYIDEEHLKKALADWILFAEMISKIYESGPNDVLVFNETHIELKDKKSNKPFTIAEILTAINTQVKESEKQNADSLIKDIEKQTKSLKSEENPFDSLSKHLTRLPGYYCFTVPVQESRTRQERKLKAVIALLCIGAIAATEYFECTKSEICFESAIWRGVGELFLACAFFYMVNKLLNRDWHELRVYRMSEADIGTKLEGTFKPATN